MITPSPKQQEIIDTEGNIVVIARPGSGKTFVLANKIRKILVNLYDYEGVIAISHTRKASKELKDRSLKGGVDKKSSFFGTIHSFFISEIVLSFGKQVFGIPTQEIEIIEPTDEKKYVENLEKNFDYKNEEHIKELTDGYLSGKIYLNLIEKYAIYILDNSASCTNYLKAKYKYIIIDEFQDCGKEQYSIFIGLKNYLGLTAIAVGDLDQSIFEFGGKSSEYLEKLRKDNSFNQFELIQNYRSHPSIINYSLTLMNKDAILIPTDSIRVYHKDIKGDERDIGKWIDNWVKRICNTPLSKIAILTKSRKIANMVYNSMTAPRRVIENSSLENNSHTVSILFDKIIKFAYDKQLTMTEIIEDFIYFDNLKNKEKKELKDSFEKVRAFLTNPNFDVNIVIGLCQQVATILIPHQNQNSSLILLKKVLSEELEKYSSISKDEVQIMTLHKSKGLEFDIVFHLDLYNGVLPYKNTHTQQELNLHYVGITRAKKGCILCTSTKRHYYNNIIDGNISSLLSLPSLSVLRSSNTVETGR